MFNVMADNVDDDANFIGKSNSSHTSTSTGNTNLRPNDSIITIAAAAAAQKYHHHQQQLFDDEEHIINTVSIASDVSIYF